MVPLHGKVLNAATILVFVTFYLLLHLNFLVFRRMSEVNVKLVV